MTLPGVLRPSRFPTTTPNQRSRRLHQPTVVVWNVAWLCVAASLALTLLGVAAIATTSSDYAFKHVAHFAVGIIGATAIALPHYRWMQMMSYSLLGVVLCLLILVLLPWVPDVIVHPRHGARRWINLFVIDFQPSELAKIAYVIGLAAYLRFRSNYRRLGGLLLPLVLTFVPIGLILIEPDLGTAMLFLPTFFAMLIAAGARMKHIMLIIVLGLAAAPMMYPLLRPHQKDRIKAMVAQVTGDDRYVQDIGYQGAKAMTLVGAGGLTGVGKQRASALIKHNKLPEDHNDMIFAVVCCRWGILGAIVTWIAFLIYAAGGLLTAALCREPFGRLVAVGLVSVLFAQMTINTGMTLGLLPITGMTLPFISAGGSSLITAWLMTGIILNIAMRRSRSLAPTPFEYDDEEDND